MITNNRVPFITIAHTLSVALFSDIRCVNWALVYGGFVPEGTMNILYPIVIGMISLTTFLLPGKSHRSGNGYAFFVITFIFAYYFITTVIWGPPRISLAMFMALSIFAFLIPLICKVDSRYFIKGIMFYPFFAVFRLDSVFPMVTEWQNFMDMDASYSFLVPVIANIVYLRFFFVREGMPQKILTIILSICNLLFCFKIMVHGSRGVVLSIFLLLVFLFIVQVKPSNHGVKILKGRLRSVTIVLLLIAASYITVFSYIDKYLESNTGVSFYAIEKIARMGAEGDLDNGRNRISNIAIKGFLDQPILGHGIDRFETVTGGNYPHNFVLEVLFDGGLVLFFILLLPFFVSVIKILRKCSKEEFAIFCTLFFASVPGALFSQDLYCMPVLWMTFGFCLSHGFVVQDYKIKKHKE